VDRRVAGIPLALLGALIAAAILALSLLAAGVPAAWVLLGVCALATLPVAVWGVVAGRFFEPLPLLSAVGVLLFVARPLQLFLSWRDLYSHFFPRDPVQGLVLLEAQEVALYVGDRLRGPLEPALARSTGACALFLVMLLAGYRFGGGHRLARRLSALRGSRTPINVRAAVGVSMAIGLVAQAAIIVHAGGPAASLKQASSKQSALSESFVLFFLAGFGFAAVILWAAWRRPRTRLEWWGWGLSVAAVCAFSVIAGSRARIFLTVVALAVIAHYLWRPWRRRELAAAFVLLLAFVSSFIVFRQVADSDSLSRATHKAGTYTLDPRVIINDITSYDDVLYATTIYGQTRPYEHGRFLVNAFRSFVPRRIDPNKPSGGDIAFRKVVWKEEFGAGRPPTAVGDFYIDFGFAGVAVGGLLVGIIARALVGLLRGAAPGRQYRVALYAIGLVILYELVVDTFSLALGFVLTLGLPFLIAVHAFGRVRARRLPFVGSPAA
jgi:oligosaccharide repeat unit polymerase